jgi:MarR family transcriptional regulator, organic hydroperoxide resistance regulator
MSETLQLTDNQKALLRLQTMTAVLERARNLELATIGLNMPQALVLYCLKTSEEPMTPMKLARLMHKQPHTVSALVKRMETQGLVSTKKDMKRKNWVRVSLTKKGEKAIKGWVTATAVPDIMGSLSKKEADALNKATQKLHNRGLELLRKMQSNPFNTEPELW